MCCVSLAGVCVLIKDTSHALVSINTGVPRHEEIVEKKVGTAGCNDSQKLFLLNSY